MEDLINDGSSVINRNKRLKTNHEYKAKINDLFQENVVSLSEAFCKRKVIEMGNEARIITNPFTCCILSNFIQPDDYLKELKLELTQLPMKKKINDLYQFEQSTDLADFSLPNISKFKKLLKEEVLEWLKKITKIPLTDKIDISCSCYTFTDHLLCHDDELEGRRIAFIYYLVPEWTEKDGGSLDLFNTVGNQPNEICETVVPKWNNFVFFEVSPISYHHVSEVLTSKKRIALSGWFHGPPLKPSVTLKEDILFSELTQQELSFGIDPEEFNALTENDTNVVVMPPVAREASLLTMTSVDNASVEKMTCTIFTTVKKDVKIDVTEWINPVYLDVQTQFDISEAFEDNSEISLPDFLQTKKYEEVCKALMEGKIKWNRKGPPNRRNILEAIDDGNISPILKECQAFLTSEAFLLILSNFTSLKLHPACKERDEVGVRVFSCIRKWSHGSYTLLHDQSFSDMCSLNAILYFNCPDWDSECGGYTSFSASQENEELLRVEPANNTLGLVYVTEGTSHFVKYVNSRAKENTLPYFHDIFCMYTVDNSDDENDTDDVEDDTDSENKEQKCD